MVIGVIVHTYEEPISVRHSVSEHGEFTVNLKHDCAAPNQLEETRNSVPLLPRVRIDDLVIHRQTDMVFRLYLNRNQSTVMLLWQSGVQKRKKKKISPPPQLRNGGHPH